MLWDGIEALNTLRNRCAHRLDFKSDLSPILERLDIPRASRFTSWSDPDLFNELLRPVSVVLGLAFTVLGGAAVRGIVLVF
jgi:hypothetical protein